KHKQPVRRVAFSEDGKRLLTADQPAEGAEGTPVWNVRVWDAAGKPLTEPLEHLRAVTEAALSADGTRLLTAAGDKKVRIWDVDKGAMVGTPIDHDDDVTRALFTHDARHVITIIADGTTRVRDPQTGNQVGTAYRLTGGVRQVALSPDGKR